MLTACFETGPVATNGYVVTDGVSGEVLAIDAPLDVTELMVAQAVEWKGKLTTLVDTHGHFDHVMDNAALMRRTGARLAIHREDEPMLTMRQARFFGLDLDLEPSKPDFYVAEGDMVAVGNLRFRVLHCPGHSPGSVVLFEESEKVAFVGDVLFAGSVGRTDLPGGDYDLLMRMIREKLFPLGDEVRVLPGHGPATTIGRERRTNPFLLEWRRL